MRFGQPIYTLNRGIVDRRGLARLDVKRLAIAAETQTNWLPKVLGYMTIRPGMGYIGATRNNLPVRMIKHVFATDDCSALELSNLNMRIWINDELLTRPAVDTTITNPNFDSNLTGWSDLDEGSTVSQWDANGRMELTGDGTSRAIREQQVSVTDVGIEHGIRIVIARGPVSLRIGSSSGEDDYIEETSLETGTHSLSITPTGDFYIRFFNSLERSVYVDSCDIEPAGVVTLPTPWGTSVLGSVRCDQSGDVLFVAAPGVQQRRIERRGDRPGARGWSVVLYRSPDGPFDVENTGPVALTPSALTGNITLTASTSLFKSGHTGALFSLTSSGQTRTVNASAADTFTESVRVTGFNAERIVSFTISGTFVATVNVQRSFDNATWANVGAPFVWTAPGNNSYNDGLDNQIVYYRIGVAAGDYTSGTAVCTISVESGSVRGIVRITAVTNSTTASAEVLADLGAITATTTWQEGMWSTQRGWPMAVAIHEGRMWWAGLNGIWGSVSDAYDSFDETFAGDAGPINRTIGSGPVDTVNWLQSLRGLLVGAQGAEFVARASTLDEPLTPSNFNLKSPSTQGSGSTPALKIDQGCYFVDRTTCKVFELSARDFDYQCSNLMELCPELGIPGIVRMDMQRKPDTRLHCVRSDGVALVGVMNRAEDVMAWFTVETSGVIEDVVVLPALNGDLDDQVYYVVKRTINGSDVRYLEKWAQEIDCRGGELSLLADSYVTHTGKTKQISAPHLIGREVVVWGDGVDLGTDDSTTEWSQTYTVDEDGIVTLPVAVTNACVGLPYEAEFKSSKLGAMAEQGQLNRIKKADHLGLVLADTHRKGIRFGPNFETLDDMPEMEDGTLVTEEVRSEYDQNAIEFPGRWTTDLRVCIKGAAPRPATVMGLTLIDAEQN